jgi:hypothetical protein
MFERQLKHGTRISNSSNTPAQIPHRSDNDNFTFFNSRIYPNKENGISQTSSEECWKDEERLKYGCMAAPEQEDAKSGSGRYADDCY